MKNNEIVFVRFRSFYKGEPPMVDTLYASGRLISCGAEELPKTVQDYIKTAPARYEYDELFGHTFLYTYTEKA